MKKFLSSSYFMEYYHEIKALDMFPIMMEVLHEEYALSKKVFKIKIDILNNQKHTGFVNIEEYNQSLREAIHATLDMLKSAKYYYGLSDFEINELIRNVKKVRRISNVFHSHLQIIKASNDLINVHREKTIAWLKMNKSNPSRQNKAVAKQIFILFQDDPEVKDLCIYFMNARNITNSW